MIWDTLKATGVPICFIEVIRTFYNNHNHILKVKGLQFTGIELRAGVRQGCPLSGLLFALCVDILIRKISTLTGPEGCIGAFADDIAMVVQDFWAVAPLLQREFTEFQAISALSLNVNKTVVIPLWPTHMDNTFKNLLKEACPRWANVAVDSKGKYLGFLIGPGAGDSCWVKPLHKFEKRVQHWASLHLGIPMNILAFNIYIVTVLEYVAQLEPIMRASAARGQCRITQAGPWTRYVGNPARLRKS